VYPSGEARAILRDADAPACACLEVVDDRLAERG
jgi:hypothetical protein